jgi:hypothetical protein
MHLEGIQHKGARLKIIVDDASFIRIAQEELELSRSLVEAYIDKHPEFLSALVPIPISPDAPHIVNTMAEGTIPAKVGPMAAVAGTISEYVARRLIAAGSKTAVVENGGDIFAIASEPVTIGIYAGHTPLADKLAFRLDKHNTPLSICSSSKMGHSLSFGDCDLACVFSKSGSLADGVATAVGNRVKIVSDIQPALEWAKAIPGVDGVIIVKDDRIGLIGSVPELVASKDRLLKDKVTKELFYEL